MLLAKNNEYYKGLDTLRALAVILVIVWHYTSRESITSSSGRLLTALFLPTGEFGVNLFFVLSGFLITSILIRQKNASVTNGTILESFYARRFLRIFPIYYLTLGVLWLTDYPTISENFLWYISYTSNFLMIKNGYWNSFAHSWSLSVEEQFYLIWPFLILYTPKQYLQQMLYATLFVGIISLAISYKLFWPFQLLTTDCFSSFGIGGLYAYYQTTPTGRNIVKRAMKVVILGALIIYTYWNIAPFIAIPYRFPFLHRLIDSLISIGIIHYTIHARNSWIKKYFLENSILMYIGKISYGIYLYHFVIPDYYNRFLLTLKPNEIYYTVFHSFDLLFKIVFVLVLSSLSYYMIEKPILAYKNRFTY